MMGYREEFFKIEIDNVPDWFPKLNDNIPWMYDHFGQLYNPNTNIGDWHFDITAMNTTFFFKNKDDLILFQLTWL